MAKIHKIKKGNIKRTKLAKQGKLKQKRHKKTVVKSKLTRGPDNQPHEPDEVESDHCEDLREMVDEEDLKFLQRAVANRSYSFLSNSESPRKKKKKVFDDQGVVEAEYEKDTEINSNKRERHLLPIKTGGGIVRRTVLEEIKDEPTEPPQDTSTNEEEVKSEDEDEICVETESPERDLSKPVSVAEMLAWREESIARYKYRIGLLSSGLLENPQERIKNITHLLEMYDEWQPELQVTLKKLVTVSLLEVFKDILPEYQIKHQEDENVKLKKETRILQTFEKRLLKGYRGYLMKLEKMASKLYKKRGDTRVFTQHDIALGELAIKCMCELLKNRPYFNYSKNIVQLLTPYLDNKYPTVRKHVADTYKFIFTQDKKGGISLDIVRRINDLVKKRKHSVKCEVISVFMALRLDDINLDDSKEAERKEKKVMAKKSRIMNLSKKEKKRKKKLEEVEKELLETKAEENKKSKHAMMTEVTKVVFMIYFRILKKAPSSGLLSTALQGLAKFAHCINIDFYHDLVAVLHKLMADGNLKIKEQLNCELTIFSILSGHGEAFNIDPNKFYTHFYESMLKIDAGRSSENSSLLIDCLEKVILANKKKLSQQRLLAFLKRLAIVSLQVEHHTALACLGVMKRIFQTNRVADGLLEADFSVAQGVYLPELPEPEHCNASSTSLFELVSLMRHYHPDVRKLARNIAHGVPATGDKSLPIELSKLSAKELLESYDPSQVIFKPAVPPPSKNKTGTIKFNGIKDKELELLCSRALESDVSADFSSLYDMKPIMKREKTGS